MLNYTQFLREILNLTCSNNNLDKWERAIIGDCNTWTYLLISLIDTKYINCFPILIKNDGKEMLLRNKDILYNHIPELVNLINNCPSDTDNEIDLNTIKRIINSYPFENIEDEPQEIVYNSINKLKQILSE